MNHLNNCPVCGASEFKEALSCVDHTVSKSTFKIVECQSCGFWFTNPIPEKNEIGDYYKSEDYVSHSGTNRGLINKIYHKVRKRAIKQKHKLILKHSHGKTLLDIGCGTGEFLSFCKNEGMEVTGLEPDSGARDLANRNTGNAVSDIDKLYVLKKASFDIITMWHVLEHVYDLNKDLEQILSLLKPNGVFVVAVPNRLSYDAMKYGEHWAAYDVPRHLYHFREKDIEALMKKHGANLKETIPMKWDAYYVSMLSEQIRGKNKLAGVLNGLRSNLKAKNNTFSSQIYIIGKQNAI